ncbi:MAG: hypothetical protein EOP84_09695 [Verrucomicrobiaceae bacterium]|nr:MAG: hypothetical protein EOP84_09695 [Verrucomicrobiaceae bacterium]
MKAKPTAVPHRPRMAVATALATALIAIVISPEAGAQEPAWWSARGVTTSAPPSDFSPTTLSQAK